MAQRVCVLVHGIHSSKDEARSWMEPLASELTALMPDLEVLFYLYGYLLGTSIALPISGTIRRRRKVKRFQKWLARKMRAFPGDTEVSVVAHSFGTYLTHRAMTYEGAPRAIFDRVIYMGGIVSSREDWKAERGHFSELLNLHSKKDHVVRLNPFGQCGFLGFQNGVGLKVRNEDLTPYAHGDYTQPGAAWGRIQAFLT